ncbi:WD40-repeat-containing domain protein [Mycena galopus ATCC 62051]|nr:WD40-repeat-containing domain protein [Mycena galopus ATCC 62051]
MILDYYGKRLATCSSDRTVKVFDVIDGDTQKSRQVLDWVAWAHPKFGNILASCSYDGKVLIWKEQQAPSSTNNWAKIREHTSTRPSLPRPHQLQSIPGSAAPPAPAPPAKRFASAGCDNLVRIWGYREDQQAWVEEDVLEGHTDWVRDVAWAPSVGLTRSYIATASQDRTVLCWVRDGPAGQQIPDVVWRVSWSLAGNLLAVSCGDGKVTLWKENLRVYGSA